MRLPAPYTAALVVAASVAPVAFLAGPATALPAAALPAECGAASGHAFPISTRVHGGPARYTPGLPPRTWYVDLSNGTAKACGGVHPVIVLSDRDRALSATAVTLQLADGEGTLHHVPLVTTDRDELIGVLDDDTTGFTVPAGRTVTVPVRLGFAAGARADEVTVSATAVQRRGTDGAWVGESAPYRLAVGGASGPGTDSGTAREDAGGGASSGGPGTHDDRTAGRDGGARSVGAGSGTDNGSDTGIDTGSGGTVDSATTGGARDASAAPSSPAGPQLAATGPRGILVRTVLAAVLVACGAALVTLVGRRRSDRP